MRIQNTALGQFAQRNWTLHNNQMSKSLQRISSGSRINSAADDPAGLAISEKMKAQLSFLKSSKLNAQQDISQVQIREGTVMGMQSMLSRMKELATQSANGTYTDLDRENLNKEYQQMMEELNRIGHDAKPKSMMLLKYIGLSEENQESAEISQEIESLQYSGQNIDAFLDGLNKHLEDISKAKATGNNEALKKLNIDTSLNETDKEQLHKSISEFTKENAEKLLNTPGAKSDTNYTISFTEKGIMVNNEGVSSDSLGLNDTDISTQEGAEKAIGAVDKAMKNVAGQLGDLGAEQNRLERTLKRIENMEENITAALSNIADADMAKEMMTLTKEKILAQAAAFAMIHVNQQAEGVLHCLGIAES